MNACRADHLSCAFAGILLLQPGDHVDSLSLFGLIDSVINRLIHFDSLSRRPQFCQSSLLHHLILNGISGRF
jgi:hypothetical protein